MNGYHEPMGTQYGSFSFVRSALLNAVCNKNVSLVKDLVENGADVFEASGPDRRSPMMEAIVSKSFMIIDILLQYGETANRVYGSDGLTAYHYAIMGEDWSSLAHLIRRELYPVTPEAGYSPLEFAKNMGYWRGVSILEQERDSPRFWQCPENAIFGEVHKRLGRIRKPNDKSEEMIGTNAKWKKDRIEYESFAPSTDYLDKIDWYHRSEDDQKFSVYSCSAHVQIAKIRKERLVSNWGDTHESLD
jgi:hypothetical protein